MKHTHASFCVAAIFFITPSAFAAGSGADVLLKALGAGATTVVPSNGMNQGTLVSEMLPEEVKLTDPFLIQFYSGFMQAPNLPLEVKTWAHKIGKQEFEAAAHLWSAVHGKIPESLMPHAEAAQAYLLYKLGLAQTFATFWIERMENESYSSAPISLILEQTLSVQGFDQWFRASNIQFDSAQVASIFKFDPLRSPLALTFHAAVNVRKGATAEKILDLLPAPHPYRADLARTVSLAYARKGDLANAARILKRDIEPEVAGKKDPRLLAGYYLQIARLLYQAGSMDGAAIYYQKIPNGIPEYLVAQEESTWIWLREGMSEKLRGSLVTLGSKLFEDRFQPEVELVRAISNLKLCFYPDVEKDFSSFMIKNLKFAKVIDGALAGVEPPPPRFPDSFSVLAQSALAARGDELKRVQELSARSISAVLPAVGPQSHWKDAEMSLNNAVENSKKMMRGEYTRQWKADRLALQEAIRKMQFVKVELMSQLALAASGTVDALPVSQSSAVVRPPAKVESVQGQQVYPFEGVVWTDELFKLRSVVRGKCLGQ